MRSVRYAIMLALLVPMPALADWPATGTLGVLSYNGNNGTAMADLFLLPSGALVARGVGNGGNQYGHGANRFLPDGSRAVGWPEDGVFLPGTFKHLSPPFRVGWTFDADEALWTMASGSPGVVRVETSGITSAKIPLTTTTLSEGSMALAPGPGGRGVYAQFGSRLQRLTPAGTIAAGWPANGVSVGGIGFYPEMIEDGAGGVLFVDMLGGVLHRRDSTGVVHSGWPSGGRAFSTDPSTIDFGNEGAAKLIRTGDHVLLVWSALVNSKVRLRAQRVGLNGVIDPAWPAAGVLVTPDDSLQYVRTLSDGANGAFVIWAAHSQVYGAHVLADGSVVTAPLMQAGEVFAPYFGQSFIYRIPAAVTSDGRLAIAWDEGPFSPSVGYQGAIRIRFLRPDLTPDPDEPEAARVLNVADTLKVRTLALGSDGDRGVMVAWARKRIWPQGTLCCPPTEDIWVARVPATPLGAGVPPSAGRLALSAPRPNPARGSASFELTLPDDSPATLELLDLAGRVVQSRSVSGAGRHAVTFDALEHVSPGLYFVRARARSGVSTSRVVVSH